MSIGASRALEKRRWEEQARNILSVIFTGKSDSGLERTTTLNLVIQ